MNNQTSKRTAIARKTASAPVRWLHDNSWLGVNPTAHAVYDHGCGRGADVKWLREQGYVANGWDPNHRPEAVDYTGHYTRGLCTYVLNTLPPEAVESVIGEAFDVLVDGATLFVTVRRDVPAGSTTQRTVHLCDELRDSPYVCRRLMNRPGGFAIYAVSKW